MRVFRLITWRWTAVFARNFLVWRKQFWTTLFGNSVEPMIVLMGIGYGLGGLIGMVSYRGEPVPYLQFLATGSLCMSTANAATFEALYSAYSRRVAQKTWDGIENSPVTLHEIIFAEIIWAGCKSLFGAIVIIAVIYALGIFEGPRLLFSLPILLVTGVIFAGLAMIVSYRAKGWETFVFYVSLVITPMAFLSGVYFPREQLPETMYQLSNLLPLTWSVGWLRALVL